MDWEIFTTDGRIRRTHYLAYLVVFSVGLAVLQGLFQALLGKAAGAMLVLPFSLVACWPSYCVAVRRAHDMGRGASFVLWIYGTTFLSMFAMAFAGVLLAIRNPLGGLLVAIGLAMLLAAVVMGFMLLFTGPDQSDTWGPNPR